MKVIYKKSMVDQLLDAKAKAMLEGKEIDHITLTNKEWAQLRRELGCDSWGISTTWCVRTIMDTKPGCMRFDGMNICKEIEEASK